MGSKKLLSVVSGMMILSLLVWQPLAAQELSSEEMMFLELPPVTVASTSRPETVLNSVSTVSVIDRAMIDRFNFSSVTEAVETVAGMNVYRAVVRKRIATARGIFQENYSNKILVMIDNVPAWNPATGEGNLDRVDIDDVERIEVLKGPASVLYGSNAYTGAINLVLKKAVQGKQMEVEAGLGSGKGGFGGLGGSYRAGGRYATADADSSLSVSAHAMSSVSSAYNFQISNTLSLLTNEYVQNKDFVLNYTYKEHSFLFNSTLQNESYYGTNIQLTPVNGFGKDEPIESDLMSYAYNHKGGELLWAKDYNVKYTLTYDYERRNIARTMDDNTHSDITGSRLVNNIDSNFTLSDYFNLEIGGNYENRNCKNYNNYLVFENKVITDNNLTNVSNNEGSLFSQLDFNYNKWNILLGSRYTDNQAVGNNVSSRGSVVYSINKNNSVKLIAGQSFRAPSFYEANLPAPNVAVSAFGVPGLRPETSDSVELSYLTSVGNLFVQALGYYATYTDNIFRVRKTITYKGYTYVNQLLYDNGTKFSAKGAELEFKYQLPKTLVFLNMDYVSGDDGDKIADPTSAGTGRPADPTRTTNNFKYAPQWNGTVGCSQDIGAFFVSVYANYWGEMDGPYEEIDPQIWANATIGYKHGDTTHYLTYKNIGDTTVVTPEYVYRNMYANALPTVAGIEIDYLFKVKFQ